jgi:hypothetical protein
MPSRPGEESPARRTLITWLVIAGFVVAAFFGTVLVLNSTLYSASGFVGSYLNALARHDIDAALATPGVVRTNDAASELLSAAALGDLGGIRPAGDTADASGVHSVSYDYRFGDRHGTTHFLVERTGTRFGVFSTWSFRQSPVSILTVTPQHAAEFTVNGVPLEAKDGPSSAAAYEVLAPGSFVLGHDSNYLDARETQVMVEEPGTIVAAEVDIQANRGFIDQLQSELDAALDKCATQQVLMPTGCPFGKPLANQVEGDPQWSIAVYPKVDIIPGEVPGTWLVPPTPAAAHLKVGVRSLFDGTLSTFDEDVAFSASYLITFAPNGTPTIVLQD